MAHEGSAKVDHFPGEAMGIPHLYMFPLGYYHSHIIHLDSHQIPMKSP